MKLLNTAIFLVHPEHTKCNWFYNLLQCRWFCIQHGKFLNDKALYCPMNVAKNLSCNDKNRNLKLKSVSIAGQALNV